MTKTEARNAGTEQGIRFAETFTNEQLVGDLDAQRDNIRSAAGSAAVGPVMRFRSVDSGMAVEFVDAFVRAANQRFLGRAHELPEVKARLRHQALVWALESMLRGAKDDVDKFAARFAEDPCYAFEWADAAMEAAAKQWVATRLQTVLEANGVDAVFEEARREALRGARYPSRSTSQPSNLMAQYKAAAYAEFAGRE